MQQVHRGGKQSSYLGEHANSHAGAPYKSSVYEYRNVTWVGEYITQQA